MKELSMYFQKFTAQTRLLSLPSPHELPPREALEYPLFVCLSFFVSLLSEFVCSLVFSILASLR